MKEKENQNTFLNYVLTKPVLLQEILNDHFSECRLVYDNIYANTLFCLFNSYT